FPLLAIGLEIERSHDLIADQDRQREIAEPPLFLRHIGLEEMVIAEDQTRPLALDNQGIERGKNMDATGNVVSRGLQRLGLRPMLLLAGALKRNGNQFLAPNARLDQ